jgi:putative ABC transport system substrate-binding protein
LVPVGHDSGFPDPRCLPARFREHGYIDGQNLLVEWRFAEGRDDRLPGFAAELAKLKVEVIVTFATSAAQAAKKPTATIPIVFTVVGAPVDAGLVANLARPGGNLTGFTVLSADITGKRLELFREAIPSMRSIVILTDPANPASVSIVQEARIAAGRLGLEVRLVEVRHHSELDPAFKTIVREGSVASHWCPWAGRLSRRTESVSLNSRPRAGSRS